MAAAIHLPRELGWEALRTRALFLDVDGTLVDIAPRPDDVQVAPELISALGKVSDGLGGALALVSGRPIGDLDRLFAPLRLAAVGVHGAEVRDVGGPVRVAEYLARQLDAARDALDTHMAQWPGSLVEDKGLALAVHYRGAPHFEAAIRALMQELAQRAGAEFTLMHGKYVFELKAAALSKATGIATLRGTAPFEGRTPVCVGDDVTDESAFAYANEKDGISVHVGAAGATAARFIVASAADVRAWIGALALSAEGAT